MKLEEVCIQLCQGAVSAWCTDKPYIVDSVPDHMIVVAFQKLAAFIPVVVQEPQPSLLKKRRLVSHDSIVHFSRRVALRRSRARMRMRPMSYFLLMRCTASLRRYVA